MGKSKGFSIVDVFIEGGSNAEKYFMKNVAPRCKDNISCKLGEIYGVFNEFGNPINTYTISGEDRKRTDKYFKKLTKIDN